ncbi:hypothetical protein ACA30_00400 [Virgibacillus soli]|nr:hypothetical protein ACA30_00400 [Virgibacillus soli]
MKIKSLSIYGYGKFTGFEWNAIGSLQVVYGRNEAGKSTMMSFIHSILFGFPARQSAQLRYEPKYSHVYGGKIVIETETDGEVVIERLNGKAGGEVQVQFEDGTIGGQDRLIQLLAGMNKSLYQNLFSFDLKGIQDVQRMQGMEIGRYLLAAGTFGTDQLLSVEEELKKQSEQLFKPNGRKPKLNILLKELKESEVELKKAKQQNSDYESLLSRKSRLEAKHLKLEKDLKEQSGNLQNVTTVLEKWAILQENLRIEQRLEELGTIDFPVDGLKRYENYIEKQILLRNQIDGIVRKLEKTKQNQAESRPSLTFQPVIHRAEKLIQDWPLFLQNQEDIEDGKRKVIEHKVKIEEIEQALGLNGQSANLNLGIAIKEQIRKLLNDQLKFQLQTEELSKQRQKTVQEFEEIEAQCQSIEENLWSETDFKQLQIDKNDWIRLEELLEEKKRQNQNRQDLSKASKKSNYIKMGEGILFLLSLMLFFWSIFTSQWLLGVFTAGISGYILFSAFFTNKAKKNSDEHLTLQIQELTAELEKRSKDYHPLFVYEEQLELRNEWKRLYQILEQKEQAKGELREQEQHLTDSLECTKVNVQSYKEALGLSMDFPDIRLEDAIDLLSERADQQKQLEKLQKSLQAKDEKQRIWLRELEIIASAANCPFENPSETGFLLKQTLKLEEEKIIRLKEWEIKIEELESERRILEAEYKEYSQLTSQLLKKAGTIDEESYRVKAKKYEEMCQLQSRQQILQDQLNQSIMNDFNHYPSQKEIKETHTRLIMSIKEIEKALKEVRQERATLDHQIAVLEEGGTYTEKLHRFYQFKANFQEEAMKWAEINMAVSLLQKTMNNYISDRFPKVVEKAKEYFSFLTDGQYSSLAFQENDQLFVKRSDGVLMEPIELSQGTKEQLYIALRFALVFVIQSDYSFPIMIDDGFVNFDKERTKKICELIQKMSKETQILIFTCHEHIKELFPSNCVYTLSSNHQQSSEGDKSHSMI